MIRMSVLLSLLCAGGLFAQTVKGGTLKMIYTQVDRVSKGGIKAELLPLNELVMPESAAVYKGKLYVANVGGAPMQSPKKGFIIVADANGANAKTMFKGLLDDPKGFGFFSDNLMVLSDHPSVKVLDLKTEKIVAELKLNQPGFLNDIVVLDSKNALLSDTGKGIVYLVSFNGKALSIAPVKGLDGTVGGVNGLYYANKKLYLVTSTFGGDAKAGNIYDFTFTKGYTDGKLSKPWADKQIGAGGLDGIYVSGDTVLISDWGKGGTKTSSQLYLYKESTKQGEIVGGGRSSIADFSVSDDGWVYMPEMSESRVLRAPLSELLK